MSAGKKTDSKSGSDGLDAKRLEAAKAALERRLRELENRLDDIEHDLEEPASADFEERATEREGDEVLESLGSSGLSEIRMIRAALARVDDGTYGECVACGELISPERLAAVPYAARCRDCA